MTCVKHLEIVSPGRPVCSPLTVRLLAATGAEPVDPARVVVDLLSADAVQGNRFKDPPEWVRFLALGPNKARDGRGTFLVDDAELITRLSNEYKGAIDLLIDFEHQFDRARENGKPAPAAAWIKELSAVGPDGTPGIWGRVDWLPDTVELIRQRKYRYLSAAIAVDDKNVVRRVMRASLTNQPAVDTASALFSTQPKEPVLNALVIALLGALGLSSIKTEEEAGKVLTPLAALLSAVAKQAGLDVAALSAMSAEQLTATLQKPLAEKLTTLSTAAKLSADASADAIVTGIRSLGVDPARYVDRTAFDDVSNRLATLAAEGKSRMISEGMAKGMISPGMKSWAEGLPVEHLTSFLSTAPVIVTSGGGGGGGAPVAIVTLSAEEKETAKRMGVTEEAFLDAKKEDAAAADRRRQLVGG